MERLQFALEISDHARVPISLEISDHARMRIAQRNVTFADLVLVMTYGRELHRTGVTFYFLGRRDIPKGMENVLERLVGATILIKDESVITAYKNRGAISTIKRKGRRNLAGDEWGGRRKLR